MSKEWDDLRRKTDDPVVLARWLLENQMVGIPRNGRGSGSPGASRGVSMTTDHPTPAPMDGERVEELERPERALARKMGNESAFHGANRRWEYPEDVAPGHVESAIMNLLASLSEAEARAERAEKERDALQAEYEGFLKESEETYAALKAKQDETRNLLEEIAERELPALEAERSRSSRVIEAAQAVADEQMWEEAGRPHHVIIRRDAIGALAAALQDTPAEEGK